MKKIGRKQEALVSIVAVLIAAAIGIFNVFTVVSAGTVGVVDFLGNVSDNTLKAGVNVVNPMLFLRYPMSAFLHTNPRYQALVNSVWAVDALHNAIFCHQRDL